MWFNNKNSPILLKFLLTSILVLGCLIWGIIGVSGFNIVSRGARAINLPILSRIIYTVFGLAAILFLLEFYNKETFIPFLDTTVLPTHLLNITNPLDSNMEVSLTPKKGITHAVFWAAMPENESDDGVDVNDAFGDYSNAGVAEINDDGKIILKFKKPISYKVNGQLLDRHVHYRYVLSDKMLDKVRTVNI